MLPHVHRLSDRRDVSRVFRTGRKVYGNLFSFSCQTNAGEHSRFAIIVGKKFFPHAVDRNRAKRLAREAIHHILPRLVSGYDGVFSLTRKPTETLSLPTVSADIETLLQKTRILPSSDIQPSHSSIH